MTSLAHEASPRASRTPGSRPGAVIADRIVLTILVLSIAAALGLAAATILADAPADLPSLIPLDAPHQLSGFTA